AARPGDPVNTSAPPAGGGPPALDQAVAFEPVEGRVDRPFRQREDVVASAAQPFNDPVAVGGLELERGEHERVEVTLQDLCPHYLVTLYLAIRGFNSAPGESGARQHHETAAVEGEADHRGRCRGDACHHRHDEAGGD